MRRPALIQQALRRLLTGRTAIVIAHRLSTVREVELVEVLRRKPALEPRCASCGASGDEVAAQGLP